MIFDKPRNNEINELLNYLYKLSATGHINENIIYHILSYHYLKPIERKKRDSFEFLEGISVDHFFDGWEKEFSSRKNTSAFVDKIAYPHYFQFISQDLLNCKEYATLYIPIDYAHLNKGVMLLFDFLDKSNIKHSSFVSDVMSCENVIVRLDKKDEESIKKVIDFVYYNLSGCLNKTNPLVPTIGGIGYSVSDGKNYNYEMSLYLNKYIQMCRERNSKVSAENFKKFLEACYSNNIKFGRSEDFDEHLLETYNIAYSGVEKEKEETKYSNEDKHHLLKEALTATYNKYGYEHAKIALLKATHGNYESITNGSGEIKYREELKKHVSKDEIANFMKMELEFSGISVSEDMNEVINNYCKLLFYAQLPTLFDTICRVTLEKYDSNQLKDALINYINFRHTGMFSRFSNNNDGINYRDQLKFFNASDIVSVIRQSLINKELDSTNMSLPVLLDTYVKVLGIEKYRHQ